MTTTSRPMCSSALATRFLLVPFLFHGRFTSVNALAKCPDGGYALTPFLLLDPRREDATCILEQAFLNYQGEITLAGLPNLKDIGEQAFAGMGGTLTITGAYPELQSIQKRAFNLAGDSNSIIDFRNGQLNELAFVDPDAFGDVHRSGGTVHFSPGPYPKYKGCTLLSLKAGGVLLRGPNDVPLTQELYEAGDTAAIGKVTCIPNNAFEGYGSDVTLPGMAQLWFIGEQAFDGMDGKLSLKGAFPNLQTIKANAFFSINAPNKDSEIDFTGGPLDELTSVDTRAFVFFFGQVKFPPTAEMPKYVGCTKIGGYGSDSSDSRVLHGPSSVPLTTALYEASVVDGTTTELNKATCIPNSEFDGYLKNVTIQGLPNLVDIGDSAFNNFGGAQAVSTLMFSGAFPMLKTIGVSAFQGNGRETTTEHEVAFAGLPSLISIGDNAFARHKVLMSGNYPKLEIIGAAFSQSLSSSIVTFSSGTESLKTIGRNAFNKYRGKLTIKGEFPNLFSIGDRAFYYAGTVDSDVDISCSSGPDMAVGSTAFTRFKGKRSGILTELKQCPTTTTMTSTTTVTSTMTSTTTSTVTTTTATATSTTTTTATETTTTSATTTTTTATATSPTVTALTPSLTPAAAASSTTSSPGEVPPAGSATKKVTRTVVAIVIVLIVLIVAVALWWFKCRSQSTADHAIPQLNTPASTTTKNHMYNIDMNQANAASAGEDFGSGDYATGPATSNAHSTLYAVPMEIEDPAAHDGGYIGVSGATGNTTTAARVKPGTVMYVSVINQDSPEYATAAANDSLYSVVSKPGRGGNGDGALPQGVLAQSTVYATAADAGDGADYDVAVHPQGGGPAGTAEYSHLALRNNAAGQQQQQNSNNHYDAGNPRAAQYAQSTVYATAATDQYAAGDAADYDVAVHPQGGGPASTAEYSHLALRNDAVGQQQQQNSNNHYDVSTPRAAREQNSSSSSNNHYDVDNPHRRRDVGSGIVSGDGDDYSTVA